MVFLCRYQQCRCIKGTILYPRDFLSRWMTLVSPFQMFWMFSHKRMNLSSPVCPRVFLHAYYGLFRIKCFFTSKIHCEWPNIWRVVGGIRFSSEKPPCRWVWDFWWYESGDWCLLKLQLACFGIGWWRMCIWWEDNKSTHFLFCILLLCRVEWIPNIK